MEFICMIVDTIAGWWGLIKDNSGQIQIIIALGAIWLAWKAYEKVLEQIKISNKQEKETNDRRFYELRFELIKAVRDEVSKTQVLHDDFLNSVDLYFLCVSTFDITHVELKKFVDEFFKEVLLDNGRGLKNLEHLKKRAEFLEDTFMQIANPELKTEHIEKILNKIFESDLIIEQIVSDLARMKSLIDAIKILKVN